MLWFGESWQAPVCEEEGHVETPVGQECFGCDKLIEATDSGVVLPFEGGTEDPRREAPYHKACFIRSLLGNIV